MAGMSVNVDHVFGAMLVGYSVGGVLFGVATTQLYLYHVSFPKDPFWIKSLAYFVWLLEFGHQVSLSHAVYVVLITNYGDASILTNVPSSTTAMNILSLLIAFVVRGFYIYRVWNFSRSWLLATGLLLVSLAGAGVFAWNIAIQYRMGNNLIAFGREYTWLIITSAAVAASSEILISFSMCWILFRERQANSIQSTMRAVDQLIIWSLETGVFTSGLLIATAICAYMFKNSFIWAGIWFIAYRAYSNSFFAVLNGRTKLRSYFGVSHVDFSTVVSAASRPDWTPPVELGTKIASGDTELSTFGSSDSKYIDIRVDVSRTTSSRI
jgi:hypothetical protein